MRMQRETSFTMPRTNPTLQFLSTVHSLTSFAALFADGALIAHLIKMRKGGCACAKTGNLVNLMLGVVALTLASEFLDLGPVGPIANVVALGVVAFWYMKHVRGHEMACPCQQSKAVPIWLSLRAFPYAIIAVSVAVITARQGVAAVADVTEHAARHAKRVVGASSGRSHGSRSRGAKSAGKRA